MIRPVAMLMSPLFPTRNFERPFIMELMDPPEAMLLIPTCPVTLSPESENVTCIESNGFVVPTPTLPRISCTAELPESVELMNFATKLFVPALASGADVSDDEAAF